MKTRLNKILSIVLVAVMLLSALPFTASAEELSGTCGDNLTWSLDTETGELLITGTGEMFIYDSSPPWGNYRSSIKSVTISDSVTTIGEGAFFNCRSLTSVTIGDSVTTIGYFAFSDCTGLTSVTIGDSVTTIGESTFFNCRSLTSVTIPDSVTTIGDYAFSGCTSLTSVTIGNGVTTVVRGAFYSCKNLEKVYYNGTGEEWAEVSVGELNDGLLNAEIVFLGSDGEIIVSGTCGDNLTWTLYDDGELVITGTGAMKNYSNQSSVPWYSYRSSIKSVTISDGVTTIGNFAFYYYSYLTSVTIPDGVTTIGVCAFCSCTGLTNITIPDSVTTIGNSAFSGCSNLTNVTMGNGIASIGESSFNGCTNLTSVTIPDSVTTIGKYAFSGCSGLTSIVIPDSVTTIGMSAFQNCSSELGLDVYKDSYAETYAQDNKHFYYYIYNENEEKIISVTVTSKLSFEINKETYTMTINCIGDMPSFASADIPWKQYEPHIKHIIISDDCTGISNSSFEYMNGVRSVVIGNGVTTIGERAFRYCTGLTSVTMGNSVTTIGNSAFCYCTGLTSVTIGKSVTIIGDASFSYCTSLTSITIGNNVTTIGHSAFHNCTSLTSVTIPDSVTTIEYGAFSDCRSLTSVTIGNSVTTIGGSSFSNCTNLTSVTIGDSVTTIGNYAFQYCNSLTSVTIGDSVTTIGSSVFNGCSNLADVILPFSVKNVYANAFTDCKSLERLKVYSRDCAFAAGCTSYYTTIVGYAGSTAEAYANENGFDFELIPDDDHEHIYSNTCDAECNICGFIRTDLIHTYTYVCDAECDLCGHIRPDVVHTFDNGCDAECNVCGDIRTDLAHTYSNGCDPECDLCGDIRTDLVHTYSNGCDPECDLCGDIRTELSHTDENNDGLCDVCEKTISDILVGVEQNFKVKVGETVYIKFIPANSGVYTYYSSSSNDTYGYIYDADKNQLRSDDDSGGNGNFSITYTFRAGTVYYLGVRYYDLSNSGEIPVTIRLDELICDHNNTHSEHMDSTCSEYGYDKVICDDCGATVSETELPLLEHSYKAIVSNPTCQSAGMVAYYCTSCKYAYVSEITDPVDHDMRWVMVTKPTSSADGVKNYSCSYCGLVEDTKVVPAFLISDNSVANIDFDSNTISGFDAGATSIDDYVSVETDGYSFTCDSAVIGTGTVIELTDGDTVITEFTAVVFGDVNGDGWYDGTDSIIVSCLANGLLSKDDVSPAFYTAADCNHDGVIDSFDVAILEQAGLLLSNVDQSKSNEELATDEAFIEYLDLIDQTPEDETVEDETIETPEAEEFDLIEFIITIIKKFFELLFLSLLI